jgi:hypothetical protein
MLQWGFFIPTAPLLSNILPDPICWMNRHEAQDFLLRPRIGLLV